MALVVRDEEDILEANLRYHLNQGVDFVIATDNGSRDGTLDILHRYQDAGVLHLIQEPSGELKRLGRWRNRAARLAATEFAADWVIHPDADEFWWPVIGTLKDTFGGIGAAYEGVCAPRSNFVARPDGGESFAERMIVRETRSLIPLKVAHRGFADIVVGGGSHAVTRRRRSDGPAGAPRFREALRPRADSGLEPAEDKETLQGLVCAPRWPVWIFHFPFRSRAQVAKKMEMGLRPGGLRAKYLSPDGSVPASAPTPDQAYSRLALDDVQLQRGLREGGLVEDLRLRDFLRQCPDPLDAARHGDQPAQPRPSALSEAEIRADLAAVELEMMRAQARMTASGWVRQGRRVKVLSKEREKLQRRHTVTEARAQALRSRLAELEASRWWRARALAARLGHRFGRP